MPTVDITSRRKIIMMMITDIVDNDRDESECDSDMVVDGGRVG
jgi:hypothetical protein